MLRNLRIQNFKCWQDTGAIRLAPITLLFGANSSGKSSIGQFLMMLKQTAELSDRKAVLFSGAKNSAVQMGSCLDMVHERDPKRRISFEYSWDLVDPFALEGRPPVSGPMTFNADVGLENRDPYTWVLEQFQYRLDGADPAYSIGMTRETQAPFGYTLRSSDPLLQRKKGDRALSSSVVRFYGFPDEVVANFQNAAFVQDLNLRHEELFRSLFYLGPLRIKPERLYSWTGTEPESVGYAGENTVAAMLAARRRKIGVNGHEKPFLEAIARALVAMDLIAEFRIHAISPERQDYEVQVRTKGANHWQDITDVGFGVSQILPVLVQGYYAPQNAIIVVEQPELHLHPRAQSELADVLIDMIRSSVDGRPRRIQLIIETHSEHLLRRLQRRIAEDKLAEDDVAGYFAELQPSPARLTPLAIDEYGNVKNWPKGFFGDEMDDLLQQGKAAVKKRLQKLQAGGSSDEA